MKIIYGSQEIHYTHIVNPKLKHAYISVDHLHGVTLKSPPTTEPEANRMVLKKAGWILEKQKLVASQTPKDIATGSRITYLGRHYYTHLIQNSMDITPHIAFNHSSFKIYIPPNTPDKKSTILKCLMKFYREKAIEKISPRITRWTQITGIKPTKIKFLELDKKWGSCSKKHTVVINIEAIKFPFAIIDYLIVHELCHIKYPKHDRGFWQEVAKYMPSYRELNTRLIELKY